MAPLRFVANQHREGKYHVMKESLHLHEDTERFYAMSQAVKARDAIYVAGTVAINEAGTGIVGKGDMAAQITQAYRNMARTLAHFDASLSDVVEDVMFVTDIEAANAALKSRRDAYANSQHPPASALIEVSKLAHPELLVEIKATAIVGSS